MTVREFFRVLTVIIAFLGSMAQFLATLAVGDLSLILLSLILVIVTATTAIGDFVDSVNGAGR